jgi:hypothetical protein
VPSTPAKEAVFFLAEPFSSPGVEVREYGFRGELVKPENAYGSFSSSLSSVSHRSPHISYYRHYM